MDTQASSSKRNAEDELDNGNEKKPKIELPEKKEEEDHFTQLFYEALEIIKQKNQVSDSELESGKNEVITNYKFGEGGRPWLIDFTKYGTTCAYFERFSQLNTEVSRDRILDAVNNCEELQSDLKSYDEKVLDVVSVGGGPGFDAVGMLSAFYKKVNCKKLIVTVVDKVGLWEPFLTVVKNLLQKGKFGDASSMYQESDTSLSFMCKDVSIPDKDYFEVVKNADIILLVRVISDEEKHKVPNICQGIAQYMKKGALLLFIESPRSPQFFNFGHQGLEKIYSRKLFHEYEEEDYFYIKGKPNVSFGKTANNSTAQIFVYKKKHE